MLEAEVGVSNNEPRQIAVQQAIEKAVMGLIAEGTIRGVWNFADQGAERDFVAGYKRQLFNGEAAPTNRGTMGPNTRDATAIPVTRPIKRVEPAQVRVECDTRRDDPTAMPPPAQAGEVLG